MISTFIVGQCQTQMQFLSIMVNYKFKVIIIIVISIINCGYLSVGGVGAMLGWLGAGGGTRSGLLVALPKGIW